MRTIIKVCLVPLLLHALTAHGALTVTHIAQGSSALHSLFIKSDGSLWAMGLNTRGELGDGTTGTTTSTNWWPGPEEIVFSNVTAVAAGEQFSLFLKSDSSLWAMGDNGDGALGDGTAHAFTNRPEQIVATNVIAIAAGFEHSLFLKSDGSLWGMGFNGNGELGDGTPVNTISSTNRPEQIVASNVTAIAAGNGFSLFLKSDGSLWATGDNNNGQLGDGTSGTFPNYTNSINRPELIVASNVTAIAAGSTHSLFLKSDGSLWAMGGNSSGQLGDGTYNDTNLPEEIVASNVTAIAAGGGESLFLKSDGSFWLMGNGITSLGDGSFLQPNIPELIVAGGVTAIAAGAQHSLFLKTDGSLWGLGDQQTADEYGQLGDGFLGFYHDSLEQGPAEVQILPLPQPVLSSPVLSQQTNLQINATCGFGGNYGLLGSPDLKQPLSQWTLLYTNSVILRGIGNFSVTLTNAVNSAGQQFFILRSQ